MSIDEININAATKSEIEKISGISETEASKIAENAPYKNWDEVKKIPGFNKELEDNLKKAHITFSNPMDG